MKKPGGKLQDMGLNIWPPIKWGWWNDLKT
jgi:hypothetical protein